MKANEGGKIISLNLLFFKKNFEFGMKRKRRPMVNFTNILFAHLRQFPCAKKKINSYFKHTKAFLKTFVQKSRA
jgi:hypothetical protein